MTREHINNYFDYIENNCLDYSNILTVKNVFLIKYTMSEQYYQFCKYFLLL